MIIERITAKTAIRHSSIDSWFWCEASLNPYQGCFHNCTYCDGKSEKYYMHEDYGTRIKFKENMPAMLESFLQKEGFSAAKQPKPVNLADYFPEMHQRTQQSRGKMIIAIGGGVCDVYQPAEAEIKLTQRLVQIMIDYKMPALIITKNQLVLRDLDLLKQLQQEAYVNVAFSITLADKNAQKTFEPNASTMQERFTALKTLRKNGVHAGVFFMPILPWIGDTDINMHAIYQQAKEASAEYVVPGGLTLKPGRNKKEFLQSLLQYDSALTIKYEVLYGNNDKYGMLDLPQAHELELTNVMVKGHAFAQQYQLPERIPRYIPEGRIRSNLELSAMLFNIVYQKGTIEHAHWSTIKSIQAAALFLETYPHDITLISEQHLKDLNFSPMVVNYIREYRQTRHCQYLLDHGIPQVLVNY